MGDSKRAMDEYTSEIMMGGTNTIALHNTCEVSVQQCESPNCISAGLSSSDWSCGGVGGSGVPELYC